MQEPTWYAVTAEVNGSLVQQDEYDDREEAVDQASELSFGLSDDLDIGSWRVELLTHWCDKIDCECAALREDNGAFAEDEGMVISDFLTREG